MCNIACGNVLHNLCEFPQMKETSSFAKVLIFVNLFY